MAQPGAAGECWGMASGSHPSTLSIDEGRPLLQRTKTQASQKKVPPEPAAGVGFYLWAQATPACT